MSNKRLRVSAKSLRALVPRYEHSIRYRNGGSGPWPERLHDVLDRTEQRTSKATQGSSILPYMVAAGRRCACFSDIPAFHSRSTIG